jgi:hypothetical protein
MKKLVQGVWSRTSITMIALAVIISGFASTQAVHARDAATDDNASIESDKDATTDDSKDALRIQKRAELEAKKQEMRAAQEAAKAQLEATREANRAARQEKLSASKLEICKAHEANINNRIARIADRSAKHLALFNQISERTQAYYLNANQTVANYDELLADVATKKSAAEMAIADITTTTADFTCEGESPKIAIEEFKISLKSSIEVLKDYKTSVKNLISGIRATNTTSNDDNSQRSDTQ